MELIEKVARGMCRADPEVRMGDAEGVVEQRVNVEWPHYVPQAKAAIRAMLDGVEPVAWIVRNTAQGASMLSEDPLPRRADELGWTEEAIYSLDALKEAVKP